VACHSNASFTKDEPKIYSKNFSLWRREKHFEIGYELEDEYFTQNIFDHKILSYIQVRGFFYQYKFLRIQLQFNIIETLT